MSDETQQHDSFDSGREQLGAVYAKALLGAADKAGNADELIEQFDSLIDDVLAKLPKLHNALASPRVPAEAKQKMIDQAFGGKALPLLVNSLKVIAVKGRLDCLREIRRSLKRLYNESRGRIEVTVKTAEPASPKMLDAIVAKLKAALGKDLDVTTVVDPELLGGVVVRVGDTVYDGSVSNRLNRMKEDAISRARQEIRHSIDRFATETAVEP